MARTRARGGLTLGRSLALAVLIAFASIAGARALPSGFVFVPTDGTFRDVRSLSRFERAQLLTQRIAVVGDDNVGFMRAQARDLTPELQALGFDARLLAAAPSSWIALPARAAWDEAQWARPSTRAWTMQRVAGVHAFWTDLASPALRDAVSAEASGRPRIAPTRGDLPNLLDAWTPPAPHEDFLLSSPVHALPADVRVAHAGSLALDFAFSPHTPTSAAKIPHVVDSGSPLAHLPASTTTLDALARVGLPEASIATGLRPAVPAVRLESRAATRMTVPARLFEALLVQPAPMLQGSGLSEWRTPLGASSTPRGLTAPDVRPETASSRLGRMLPAPQASYASAGAGYRLPLRNLRLDLNLEEFRYGNVTTAAGATSPGLARLQTQDASVNVGYSVNPDLTLNGGYIYTRSAGTSSVGFDPQIASVTQDRAYPYLGVDYKISNNARWKMNIRLYNTPLDLSTTGLPRNSLNLSDPQVTTEVKVRF